MELLTILERIEVMIDNAAADESRTARLREVIEEAARREGREITKEEVGVGVQFVERYIRAVPKVLREALDRSLHTFAEAKMSRMVKAAVAYWDADGDVIPDDQGLLGILDDAYCSLSLVSQLSKRFASSTGEPLVSEDLSSSNAAVRKLLGDEIGYRLDDYVDEALADASIEELMTSLTAQPPPPPPEGSSWDPQDDDMVLRLFGVI